MEITKEDEKKFAILYERYMEKKRISINDE